VDTIQPDPAAAAEFYAGLFGWEFESGGPRDGHAQYFLGRLRGRDVAGIAPMPPMSDGAQPGWATQVQVDDLDESIRRTEAAGGSVIMPRFDARPAGWLGVIADPGGAVICLWQPLERRGAQIINEPSAWSMSTLQARDPDQAAAFYGEVFGWTSERLAFGDFDIVLFRLPGYVGGEQGQPVPRDTVAVLVPEHHGQPDSWSVGFWVEDADETLARALELGGTAAEPIMDGPTGRMAIIADPAGAVFTASTAPAQH
jgi:uncharacterized protein